MSEEGHERLSLSPQERIAHKVFASILIIHNCRTGLVGQGIDSDRLLAETQAILEVNLAEARQFFPALNTDALRILSQQTERIFGGINVASSVIVDWDEKDNSEYSSLDRAEELAGLTREEIDFIILGARTRKKQRKHPGRQKRG